MSYSELLRPRAEVLSDEGIDGIIDLANLKSPLGKKVESDPQRFFSLTYPTADIKIVIQKLSDRFSNRKNAPGLFLFEGLKGSGKSHLLLLIYHLFKNFDLIKEWLNSHGIVCELPKDTEVIVNKFTDSPLSSIWDLIYERFSTKRPNRNIVQPSLEEIEHILGEKKLILILDELEQGIRVINDSSVKAQNIAFLQMLSELASRSDKVTIFASIYSDQDDPGSTLKRVPNSRVQFANSTDKVRVVLHRLFENSIQFNSNNCIPIIESYCNIWKRHQIFTSDDYKSKMLISFPFLPEVLEVILERVPARGGFQSIRGALGFLANMVRLTHNRVDIITGAHATLNDREVSARLSDIDPSGDLISRACGNLNDLKKQSLVFEIGSTVMLYTLTSSGRSQGATREELIRHVINPKVDINDFENTLLALQKYASHFHVQEGRYFFDLEENADAKVELRSLTIDPDGTKARSLLHTLWRDEIFREPNTVFYQGIEETKELLQELDKNRLRYIIATRRLTQEERHELFFGVHHRNKVILLEPKDDKFNLDTHKDLRKWAQRQIAAHELTGTSRDAARRNDYEKIAREDKINCMEAIKRAGLVFIHWEQFGESVKDDRIEEEVINGATKEHVTNFLSQQLFPLQLFEEHLTGRLIEIINNPVKDIDRQYRTTLGFPVPVTEQSISKVLRDLCKNGLIGIRHSRGNYCKENPNLNETELFEAVVSEPFEISVKKDLGIFPPEIDRTTGKSETEIDDATVPVTSPPSVQKEEITIPSQTSSGELRKAFAMRLQEYPEAEVTRIKVTIFLEKRASDLSSLPSSLRGSLNGEGEIMAEINITKKGKYTKGDVEQIIESLPLYQGAAYSARLDILIPQSM